MKLAVAAFLAGEPLEARPGDANELARLSRGLLARAGEASGERMGALDGVF